MKYKTVLFDWDGCLFNNLVTWLDIYIQVLEKYNLKVSCNDIAKKMFGNWNGPLLVGIKQEELEKFNQELLSLADELLPQSPLHINAKQLLEKLIKSSVKLGLVSTSKLETVKPILDKYLLTDLFLVIITGDMVTKHKPDPESIYLAMEKLGAEKEMTVMVGDSEKDTMSATNAGIDSILYLPEVHKEIYDFDFLKNTNPTYIVNNLIDITEIVIK